MSRISVVMKDNNKLAIIVYTCHFQDLENGPKFTVHLTAHSGAGRSKLLPEGQGLKLVKVEFLLAWRSTEI